MKVDMSPEAVSVRMEILNQLWELSVELQKAEIIDEKPKCKELQQEIYEQPNRDN